MTRLVWIGLLAVAALSWPAGLLNAGDLYGDKGGPKLEPLVLPKPAEVQTFASYPDKDRPPERRPRPCRPAVAAFAPHVELVSPGLDF